MFVPATMTSTQMTGTGVLVGSVAGAVIVLLAVVAVAVVIVVFQVSDAPLHLRNIF